MIYFTSSHFLLGIAALTLTLIFLARQKRSFWYLLFFSIFWIYLLRVVSVIVFPIVPGDYNDKLRLSLNLVPFNFDGCEVLLLSCLGMIVENILVTIPFGFGISFLARLKPKDFLWLAPLVGLAFEGTQLIVSLVFRSGFRAVDINDVILNAIGVWLGYFFFRIFGYLYLYVTQKFEVQHKFFFTYIYDVIRQSTDH